MRDIGRRFAEAFGRGEPTHVARAPGRVNIIGEHTDYNGGYVLPMAIDRWAEVALSQRNDRMVRAFACGFGELAEFHLPPKSPGASGGWRDYLVGVVLELSRGFPMEQGFDVVIAGDVPLGAGLSSSAALEVALALGLVKLYGAQVPDVELVRLCQKAENEFVGTSCGIMDQYVALLAKEGCALLLDVATLSHQHVPLDLGDVAFLVVDSGVRRSLSQSGYNTRREECRDALLWLQRRFPSREISSLRDVTSDEVARLGESMPQLLLRRASHVVQENERVLSAVHALQDGDSERLGDLLYSSHASLRDYFEVSTLELDFLVDWGMEHGALGARLIGGGFGGATLHLVTSAERERYEHGIKRDYAEKFGLQAAVMRFRPGPGGKQLADREGE